MCARVVRNCVDLRISVMLCDTVWWICPQCGKCMHIKYVQKGRKCGPLAHEKRWRRSWRFFPFLPHNRSQRATATTMSALEMTAIT